MASEKCKWVHAHWNRDGEAGLTSVGGAAPLVCPLKSCIPVYWGLLESTTPGSNVMHAGDSMFSRGHIKKVKMKFLPITLIYANLSKMFF